MLSSAKFARSILMFSSLTMALTALPAQAASGPGAFSYEGRLYDLSGTPSAQTVTFTLGIYDKNGTCLLRSEQFTAIDLSQSNGYFSLTVGKGTLTGSDPGRTMIEVFANGAAINGASCVFNSAAGDARKLRVTVWDGVASTDLTPDVEIGTAPFAMVADTLQGKAPIDFLQVPGGASQLTQANLDSVFATAANVGEMQALAAGNSTKYAKATTSTGIAVPSSGATPATPQVGQMWYEAGALKFWNGSTAQTLGVSGVGITSLTAGTGIVNSPATITTTGSVSVDVGTTANKIVQLDGTAKLPAVDGSQLTSLSAANLATGTLLAARMPAMTGDVTSSVGTTVLTLGNSGVGPGTYGSVTVDAKGRVMAGANPTTLSGHGITDGVSNAGGAISIQSGLDGSKPAAGTAGRVYIATDAQKVYYDNGASWVAVGSNAGAGGTLTSVGLSAPGIFSVTGSPLTADGTISLGFVTQAARSVFAGPTGTSGPPSFRSLNIADVQSSVTGSFLTGTGCIAGQGLIYNSVTDAMSCASIFQPSGTEAGLPAAGTAGRLYIATDSKKIFRDNGTTWDIVGSTSAVDITGTLPVTKGGTGTANGSIAAAGALNLAAGGTNQNVTLQPSGTGSVVLNGKVGIGTTAPVANLDVHGTFALNSVNAMSFPSSDSAAGGGGSIAIGNEALSNQNGLGTALYGNTAIGYYSMSGMSTNTTTMNTAVGFQAMQYSNSGAAGNAAFGANALQVISSGSNNAAVGSNSLRNLSTGVGNVAVGFQAGIDNTTGSNNVVLGSVPTSGFGITTGSNNILVGFDTRPPSPAGNNQLNIGNLIYGTGLASGATLSTGNVGIGTTTPNSRLDVAGSVRVGTDASACVGALQGAIRLNGTALEYCNGTAWAVPGGGGSFLSTTGGTMTGALNISSGGAVITGGLNNNYGGITSAGNITGVGANIMGSGAMTVAAGGTAQNLTLNSSTTGSVNIGSSNGVSLQVQDGGASTVNYVVAKGGATGQAPGVGVEGTDPNISLSFYAKGTGSAIFPMSKVGIGTSAPADSLHVVTNMNGPAGVSVLNSSTGLGGQAEVSTKNDANNSTKFGVNSSTFSAGGLFSANTGYLMSDSMYGLNIGTTYGGTGEIRFFTGGGTPNQRMEIDNGGNVGIGTTAPVTNLHVEAPMSTILSRGMQSSGNGGGFDGSNDVSAFLSMRIFGSTMSGTKYGQPMANLALVEGNAASALAVGTATSAPLILGTSNIERMRISPAGNVGIGTTMPQTSLDLSSRTDAVRLPAGNNAQRPGTPMNGDLRYNTDINSFEGFMNGSWAPIGLKQHIVMTTNGTFTTPTNTSPMTVYKFIVIGGGGGGGGGGTNNGGGGGGGGAVQITHVAGLAPGTNLSVTVGTPGSGGTAAGSGGTGTATTITGPPGVSLSASPGMGGGGGSASNGTPGTGGTSTLTDKFLAGLTETSSPVGI